MSTTLTLRTAGLPLAAFGGAMLLASTALSAPINPMTLTSVVGMFENAVDVPGTLAPGNLGGASTTDYDAVTNTATIHWGVPLPSPGPQSGYSFTGAAPGDQPAPTTGVFFDLGEFTHENWQIRRDGLRVGTVDLDLTIDIAELGTFNSIAGLTHFETPNVAGTCEFGEAGDIPCPDEVTITISSLAAGSKTIGAYKYSFFVEGFLVDGALTNALITQEFAATAASIVGRITVEQIPLPAAGWLLFGALGGLGLMSRRRKA
jgi:hypothetical protein